MTTRKTWLAMTAATVPVPESTNGFYPEERCLVGIGLLTARYELHRWRFVRRSYAIPAGVAEAVLLRRATAWLREGRLIGWQVDQSLIPALLDAAVTAPPTIANDFAARLHSVLRSGTVDMALDHGGAGAPPLATVATDRAIYAPARSEHAITSAWATGFVGQLRLDLADEALAIWQLFIRSPEVAGLDAETATNAWIARRRRLAVAGLGEGDRLASLASSRR